MAAGLVFTCTYAKVNTVLQEETLAFKKGVVLLFVKGCEHVMNTCREEHTPGAVKPWA